MANSESVTFGKVSINKASAISLGKEGFKEHFRGKLKVDLDTAWNEINKKEESKEESKSKDKKGSRKSGESFQDDLDKNLEKK